jgi:adenosylcobyric acid synthase
MTLLQPGIDWLEQYTGKSVLGTLPYLQNFHLAAEDAIAQQQPSSQQQCLSIAVPVLSRISNHTDFDPLRLHPQVDLQFITPGKPIPHCDLIIIPGSKNVRQDLQWLREQGWDKAINKHLRYGGKLMGICGGFQMLGDSIDDPEGIEGSAGKSQGLKLLAIDTVLKKEKQLRQVSGYLNIETTSALIPEKPVVTGYEIHAGISKGAALCSPFASITEQNEGVLSEDKQIIGTYLHGVFDHSEACSALLSWAGLENSQPFDYAQHQEQEINRLADCIEQHLALEKIFPSLAL